MTKTIYEVHPVTPERKAELRAQGFKIIDASFAPVGYVHPDAEAKRRPRKSEPAEV
jgi:4-hydroxy-3-methylbut-2-enyl diphosphate reductase IspH